MNAYDLAKDLDVGSSEMEYNHNFSDWKLLSDAANMLRQQADEIVKLKLEWQYMYDKANMDQDLATYQQQAAQLWSDSCTSNRSTDK